MVQDTLEAGMNETITENTSNAVSGLFDFIVDLVIIATFESAVDVLTHNNNSIK